MERERLSGLDATFGQYAGLLGLALFSAVLIHEFQDPDFVEGTWWMGLLLLISWIYWGFILRRRAQIVYLVEDSIVASIFWMKREIRVSEIESIVSSWNRWWVSEFVEIRYFGRGGARNKLVFPVPLRWPLSGSPPAVERIRRLMAQ